MVTMTTEAPISGPPSTADLESGLRVAQTSGVFGVILAATALIASLIAWSFATRTDARAVASSGPATSSRSVTVTLSEFAITPQMVVATVGDTLQVKNEGTVAHTLTVQGSALTTPLIDGGKSDTIDTSSLPPGEYIISCNVPGHKASGMQGMLHLGAKAGAASAAASPPAPAAGLTAAEAAAGMTMSSAAMDKAMHDSTAAFPAQTQGLGGQDLAPTTTPDGTKQFDLTTSIVKWEEAPGKTVDAWAYNGVVPGPTIRVSTGDRIRIVLHNQLPESTVIHFHGLEVPNSQDGVPYLTQDPVGPGQTFTYNFVAKGPASGMYHSHFDSTRQVANGLAGAIFVDDMPLPPSLSIHQADVQRQMMFLNDSGTIGLTINGKSFPATAPIAAKLNDWVEVTYFNEGQMIHPMHLHGLAQMIIARDGYPLASPELDDTVTVAPGQRITVLVHATVPGAWAWHCHILSHAENDQGMFGMVTALIVK